MPNLTTDGSDRYARRTRNLGSSTIRELLKYTQRPEMISFAGGMPAPELFPQERFREAACRILDNPAAGQSALLINPCDRILVEAPTYLGALHALDLFGAAYASVPIDDDGLQTGGASLNAALAEGAKFMYLLYALAAAAESRVRITP